MSGSKIVVGSANLISIFLCPSFQVDKVFSELHPSIKDCGEICNDGLLNF
jgi:hypothetical protein